MTQLKSRRDAATRELQEARANIESLSQAVLALRRWNLVFVGVALVALAVPIVQALRPRPPADLAVAKLTARSIEVTDQAGRTRISLTTGNEVASLRIQGNQEGSPELDLGASSHRVGLNLYSRGLGGQTSTFESRKVGEHHESLVHLSSSGRADGSDMYMRSSDIGNAFLRMGGHSNNKIVLLTEEEQATVMTGDVEQTEESFKSRRGAEIASSAKGREPSASTISFVEDGQRTQVVGASTQRP